MSVARPAYFVATCLRLNGCAVTCHGSMVLAARGGAEWNNMAPPEDQQGQVSDANATVGFEDSVSNLSSLMSANW